MTTEYCCYVKESSVTNSRVRGLDYDSTCGIAVCTDGCMCACGMYVSWVLGCPGLCLSESDFMIRNLMVNSIACYPQYYYLICLRLYVR